MIAWMFCTASGDVMVAPASACEASGRTSDSTSSRARSDCGLNSLFRSAAKSPVSPVDGCGAAWGSPCCSAMGVLALLRVVVRRGLWGRRQGLEKRRVLQQPRNQLLGPGLSVHVCDEV